MARYRFRLDPKKIESCRCGCDVAKDKSGRWKVFGEIAEHCTCQCDLLLHSINCKCQECFYWEDKV
jgi:hypothetical protein